MRKSEQQIRTVVTASKDAMIAVNDKGRITLFNPAAEQMFGYSSREIMGRPPARLMPSPYSEAHPDRVSGYFTKGVPNGVINRTVELPALRSDGTHFPVELSLSPGEAVGQRFVLACIRDITERKKSEERLRKEKNIKQVLYKILETAMLSMSLEEKTSYLPGKDTGGRRIRFSGRRLHLSEKKGCGGFVYGRPVRNDTPAAGAMCDHAVRQISLWTGRR